MGTAGERGESGGGGAVVSQDVCGVGGGAVGTAGERGESGGGGAVVSLHSKMSVG